MRRIVKKSVLPIYAAAGMWLIYCLFFPLYALWHFLVVIAATAVVFVIFKKLCPDKIIEVKEPEKPEPKPELSPEVAAVVAEGKLAMSEMDRLKKSIRNPEVKSKITQIMILSDKIVRNAEVDVTDLPRIKKFLNYYLPTTIKLLNAYDRMDEQGIRGENIGGTIKRIEDMLDTIIAAYEKQLDALFADEALDIETDIEVLDGMLSREGLKNSGPGEARQGN
ncbi:MAG: hypothetical protein GX250_08835 [Clostridiales bacterium]|nr:hypothetical protein [Clostridiales bacterium]